MPSCRELVPRPGDLLVSPREVVPEHRELVPRAGDLLISPREVVPEHGELVTRAVRDVVSRTCDHGRQKSTWRSKIFWPPATKVESSPECVDEGREPAAMGLAGDALRNVTFIQGVVTCQDQVVS